jgi:hypothetical protein
VVDKSRADAFVWDAKQVTVTYPPGVAQEEDRDEEPPQPGTQEARSAGRRPNQGRG